ncbi:MAG TPA: enoyl-CoA hydratase/isomerase family protein [Pyrinomonadaceae bacterium]
MTSAIIKEEDDETIVIRFNRPTERNPLSKTTLEELSTILASALSQAPKSLIITGTDDVFASGANIRELQQLDPASAAEFSKLGQSIIRSIAEVRQLTIAAINGYCIGGALDLALACDIRIASPNAVFAHPGARLGIITGWGGTQRLPRIIGKTRALELFITARRFSAAEALAMGLVTKLSENVVEAAKQLVQEAG